MIEKEASLGRHQTGRNSDHSLQASITDLDRGRLFFAAGEKRPPPVRGATWHSRSPARQTHRGRGGGRTSTHACSLRKGMANGLTGLREVTEAGIREIEPRRYRIAGCTYPRQQSSTSRRSRLTLEEVGRMGGSLALSIALVGSTRPNAMAPDYNAPRRRGTMLSSHVLDCSPTVWRGGLPPAPSIKSFPSRKVHPPLLSRRRPRSRAGLSGSRFRPPISGRPFHSTS